MMSSSSLGAADAATDRSYCCRCVRFAVAKLSGLRHLQARLPVCVWRLPLRCPMPDACVLWPPATAREEGEGEGKGKGNMGTQKHRREAGWLGG